MSPIQAMERSYRMLRDMLRTGGFAPGARLDANRLAEEIGVSMTPVRDALNRLAGERLVDASAGEGFHVPRLGENGLRQLYEWNAAIVTMAVRTTAPAVLAEALARIDTAESIWERTSVSFDGIADTVPNTELRAAVHAATVRLHPFRMVEAAVLGDDNGELATTLAISPAQVHEIRRYHVRRMRAAADILYAVEARISPNTL